jgi:hypothetical protein
MAATFSDRDDPAPSDTANAVRRVDPGEEDAFWELSYWRERYYRQGLDYEDYAPAYCVGYIGYAQYGGAFEDAETWLCANWVRIKGDSRLGLDEARLAMRSAWERLAQRAQPRRVPVSIRRVVLLRRRLRIPAFKFAARLMR